MLPFTVERIDHVVFRVRDLAASVAFYGRVLGCHVVRERPDLGLVHLRAGASMVDLVSIDGRLGRVGGEGPKAEGRNVDHLCLRVEPFDEQRIVAHLAEHGVVPKGPASTNFGAEGGKGSPCTSATRTATSSNSKGRPMASTGDV